MRCTKVVKWYTGFSGGLSGSSTTCRLSEAINPKQRAAGGRSSGILKHLETRIDWELRIREIRKGYKTFRDEDVQQKRTWT